MTKAEVFDCHLCGVKRTTLDVFASQGQQKLVDYIDERNYAFDNFVHEICKCNSCEGFFYRQHRIAKDIHFMTGPYPQHSSDSSEAGVIAVYPSAQVSLSPAIDKLVRQYFTEAISCLDIGANDAASVMFRKCVYRICNEQGVPTTLEEEGKKRKLSGKERVQKLGLPKPLNDVLCGVDGVGGDAAHEDEPSLSPQTLHKLKDALKVVFRLLYEDKEMLKNFTESYSQENQQRKGGRANGA